MNPQSSTNIKNNSEIALTPLTLKKSIQKAKNDLELSFKRNSSIKTLIENYTNKIDKLLVAVLNQYDLSKICTLIAIGGYGRKELFPYSDIDMLLLTKDKLSKDEEHRMEDFIQFLWDAHLDVAHSVRNHLETITIAKNDLTVISSLIDMRYLAGCNDLFVNLHFAIQTDYMWSSKDFYKEKINEQENRYTKYGDSAFNLQPDIKNGPGGLRDIQMIEWITKRYFATTQLNELLINNFLTKDEYRILIKGQRFLWEVRLALQLLTKNRKTRLLFDHQISLAKQFSYCDKPHELAIEQFMKKYYRTIMDMRELNDMILQLLREAIIDDKNTPLEKLNERFQIKNGYIEVTHKNVFLKKPSALLEIFVLLAKNPKLRGVSATTIRLIREHRHLIDDDFLNKQSQRNIFLDLLRQSINVSEQLQRMNRYGILGKYIPEFGTVIGQMQYDLFHIYTVDQHSIFIVRNLRRFTLSTYYGKFPLCHEIITSLSKPETLYIAALFHDLGKGCGGDHSEIGAKYAEQFCLLHELSEKDTKLVVWLVKNHLLMSQTAQRQDIYDPITIEYFANLVDSQRYLDHLYLLTVADICATNPKLWNGWRDTLLKELYTSTKNLLSQQNKTVNEAQIIGEKKSQAMKRLSQNGFNKKARQIIWPYLSKYYFLRESTANIVWHVQAIIENYPETPLVLLKQHHSKGGTEVFIYTPDVQSLFAKNTTVLSNLQLNIVEARIYTTRHAFSIQVFIILDENSETIQDEKKLKSIKKALSDAHHSSTMIPRIKQRRIPASLRHFDKSPKINFCEDTKRNRTTLSIICPDRPGLLANVSQAFIQTNTHLQTAKIATMGERIEDTFYITNEHEEPLTHQEQVKLKNVLLKKLLQLIKC